MAYDPAVNIANYHTISIYNNRIQCSSGSSTATQLAIYCPGAFCGFIGKNLFNRNIAVGGWSISDSNGFNSIVERDIVFNSVVYS